MAIPAENAKIPVKPIQSPNKWLLFTRKNGLQFGIIGVFLGMWLLFIIAAPRTFLSPQIYGAFMNTIPFFGIMALPLTLVVIAGEMDLSFPSIMAMGTAVFVLVFKATGSVTLAIVAALITGFIIGLINGFIVVRIGIPSLIATIGTMFLWRGVVLVATNGTGATLVDVRGTIWHGLLVGRPAQYLPAQMIWMLLIGVAMWFLLNRHKFGAHVYLIGDNENSARLMGVNANRTRMLVFAIVGVAAAFAGLLSSFEVSYFWPSMGEGYLMRTLSSVFLGGTSVFGGTGTILGTFIAAFIIGAIEAGIIAVGLTGFYTQLIYGLIIVLSVAMHVSLSKRLG
jgi:simple sugar transport system permease protein